MTHLDEQSRIIYQASPVMFGARPFLYILYLLLCPLLIGFILLYGWHCKRKGIRLVVDESRISLETGKISRSTNDIFHENIHSIQTNQTAIQRIFNIGSIIVQSTRVEQPEIAVNNIPCPMKLKKLLEDRHYMTYTTESAPENISPQ